MHSRSEVLGNSWVPVTITRECDGRDDELGMCGTVNGLPLFIRLLYFSFSLIKL